MKFLCERDALKDALAAAASCTKGTKVPILQHVLIRAEGSEVVLTGHDVDSCCVYRLNAEVGEPGAVAMPADRFVRLIGGADEGSQVTITCDDERVATVKCGRSIYRFGVMPAADFPDALSLKDSTAISLDGKDILRLFKVPAPFLLDLDAGRPYFGGIFFHHLNGKPTAVGSDGHTLVRTIAEAKTAKFPDVIVPPRACSEFSRIASTGTCKIEVGANLIAIETANQRFVSKLIDAVYVDYAHAIARPDVPPTTVDYKEFDAALARLQSAVDPDRPPIVKIAWDAPVAHIDLSLEGSISRGDEQIECDCAEDREAGQIAAKLSYIRELAGALGGKLIRIYLHKNAQSVVMENPDDPGIVATCFLLRF